MLGFLPTRAYRPGTPGATTFLSPLSGTFNYGWDSFKGSKSGVKSWATKSWPLHSSIACYTTVISSTYVAAATACASTSTFPRSYTRLLRSRALYPPREREQEQRRSRRTRGSSPPPGVTFSPATFVTFSTGVDKFWDPDGSRHGEGGHNGRTKEAESRTGYQPAAEGGAWWTQPVALLLIFESCNTSLQRVLVQIGLSGR